jgi:hypothetical protein
MGRTAEQFIAKWKNAQGGERSQAQTFLNELCDVLGVERPHEGDYKFEYALKGATDFADL